MDRIKLIPLPICGVILSIFGLGLFFKDTSKLISNILAILGVVLILFLMLKLILFPNESREDLKSPIILGTSGTLPMAVMILAVFIKDLNYQIGFVVWIMAFACHAILIVYFTKEHILNFKLELVYTNYFVVFIGIGMGSITATSFNLQLLCDGIFIFSLASLIVLLILVSWRYVKVSIADYTFKPLICIYAAPFSLILCAFIQTSFPKLDMIIISLYILSVVFYFFGLVKVVEYIRLPFFPTFTAFTFPFVISATATKHVMKMLNVDFEIFLLVQVAVAIVLVTYVFIRYVYFVITAPQN